MTKLVASLVVKNELGRYLEPCVLALLDYCDEVRVLDDGSDDGGYELLAGLPRVEARSNPGGSFFEHEGRVRDCLIEWTLCGDPTHVLAIDADEVVSDPDAVRRAAEGPGDVWSLSMEEVWEATPDGIRVRADGQWGPHPVGILYRVPPGRLGPSWHIADRALACGRVPLAVVGAGRPTGASILHLGWANERERVARHRRYADHDGGRFHASAHLDSILAPPGRVRLLDRPWPPALDPALRADLAARASR